MNAGESNPSEPPKAETPAMRQYRNFKERHPQCVLFFRMGDFYEMFHDDALLAHKTLGITLTQRSEGVPMAGVPYHSVEGYIRRMIQAGHRVAICDQMEEASAAKGVVRRDVTRVITPGTLTDESLLDEGQENPLAAIHFGRDGAASLAWAELSTGRFQFATVSRDEAADELARIGPRELLYTDAEGGAGRETGTVVDGLVQQLGCVAALRPSWQFQTGDAYRTLCEQFDVRTLEGFGLTRDDAALGACGAVVFYLLETQSPGDRPNDPGELTDPSAPASAAPSGKRLGHLQPPRRLSREDHLVIDQISLRSLEIETTLRSGSTDGSLLGTLQFCVTPMGKRMLRQWLCYPLRRLEPIERRQRVVGAMREDDRFLEGMRQVLGVIQDVQRIVGRIAIGRATPRDLVALGGSAAGAQALVEFTADRPAVRDHHRRLKSVAKRLNVLSKSIRKACVESPPPHLREGGLIRDGYDSELDEQRSLQSDSHAWLAGYQTDLARETKINNLKIGFNKVFGYYIELSAANRDRAPDSWTRKQTLKNAERFITPDLKQYEGKVLSAKQHATEREQVLFAELCTAARDHLAELHEFAEVIAELDVLACFAQRARYHRYVQPTIVAEPVLDIRAGRHPVLDGLLKDRFVANDVVLGRRSGEGESGGAANGNGSADRPTLGLITGPNMAGKSTYIRQAALITLMAHTGSFVPADAATVGLCDRVFTRVGASDELHAGRSTFMVEMIETANICHHATAASLVILDEIGRGTSTLDGLSLAWAITEHLAACGCRTLFATHYHELTALAERFDQVTNLNVTVREWGDKIVFLHRIVPGATDRSYGIHVAKIAGLPDQVVRRAGDLLSELAVNHQPVVVSADVAGSARRATESQMSLFTEYLSHPAVSELREMKMDTLTPLEAFDALRRLSRLAAEAGAEQPS